MGHHGGAFVRRVGTMLGVKLLDLDCEFFEMCRLAAIHGSANCRAAD